MSKALRIFAFGIVLAVFAAFLVLQSCGGKFAVTGTFGDSFGVLTSLFTGLGFAGLLITISQQNKQMTDKEMERQQEVEERRSLFNLESSITAYQKARELLEDHNNRRIDWIKAARMLEHARVLGCGVTVDAHMRVLEFSLLEFRTFFAALIEAKSAAFFYGFDGIPLEAAAAASTRAEDVNGIRVMSTAREIPEPVLRSVWEAAQWPQNYNDPVGKRFTTEERIKLRFQAQGLLAYLEFKDRWISFGGVLTAREQSSGSADTA